MKALESLRGLLPLLALGAVTSAQTPSEDAQRLAELAHQRYGEPLVTTLAELVAFDTYRREGIPNAEHPSFKAMSARLGEIAAEFGLDFADYGAVVVIGLGDAEERLGVITHGDVVPVTPSQWAKDPFTLDLESEPGRLVGRGTEDDKGPIACALYAMRTIKEEGLPLSRRIELVVSYTEESDWTPFQEFLAEHPAPQMNVAFDAQYPVVVAEKGWCSLNLGFPLELSAEGPRIESLSGGFFLSQVPESAEAVIADPTPEIEAKLLAAARADGDVRYTFEPGPARLTIRAAGVSAHSSTPEDGRNAITHLAAVLGSCDWPANAQGWTVRLINDLIGTGFYAERFGDLGYRDAFMGPLTLSLGVLEESEGQLFTRVNLRRPVGRTADEVQASFEAAVAAWKKSTGCTDLTHSSYVGQPHPPVDAGHVPVLLDTFRHYTGITEAAPVSIGGGTHARLVPGGVNFGPSMPGEAYTGHSEHEFLSREQLLLNLRMYTSLLVDLAGA